jgi:hypothetical protein
VSESPPDDRSRRASDSGENLSPVGISGRVAFDPRGDAVWEFQTADGDFARDANTELVRKLDAAALSLEQTAVVKRPAEAASGPQPCPGGGFNPYDRAAPPAPARTALKFPPVHPVVVPQRRGGGLLQRLWSWHRGHGRR